jgi:hypothetical protein
LVWLRDRPDVIPALLLCCFVCSRAALIAAALPYGPALSGTKAQANKFHDDKSLYTGTHANGGPAAVAKGAGHEPLAKLLDRGDCDVRGVPLAK